MSPPPWVCFTDYTRNTCRFAVRSSITNTLILWIAAIILALFTVDYLFFDSALLIGFMKLLLDLIEYIAFWR